MVNFGLFKQTVSGIFKWVNSEFENNIYFLPGNIAAQSDKTGRKCLLYTQLFFIIRGSEEKGKAVYYNYELTTNNGQE